MDPEKPLSWERLFLSRAKIHRPMIRWLVIFALAWALYRLLEFGIEWLSRATREINGPTRGERSVLRGDELVACAGCGVHVPRSRALVQRGQSYCSAGCRDGGGASRPEP